MIFTVKKSLRAIVLAAPLLVGMPMTALAEGGAAAEAHAPPEGGFFWAIAIVLAIAAWHERRRLALFSKDLLALAAPGERLRRPTFWMACVLLGITWLLFEKAGSSIWRTKFGTSLFTWLWMAWNDPIYDSAHGKLIPFISLGLLWWKRCPILALPPAQDWRALWGIGAALSLHWMGMRGQIPRLSVLALILLLWSMVWLAQGWPRAKMMSFPFAFLVFMIPMNFLESIVAFPMRMLVTKASAQISHLLGIAVMRDGTRLFDATGAYQYDVAPACSGIRSLTAIIMLSIIYGHVTQDRTWKKFFLFLAGFPLAIAGNVVRITAIVIAAQCFGQAAGNVVHEWFGFLIFLVVVLLLVGVSQLINAPCAPYWHRLRARLASQNKRRNGHPAKTIPPS